MFILQSPDGDIIDCVLSHKQPAFDHPLLKGQKPLVFCTFFVNLIKKNLEIIFKSKLLYFNFITWIFSLHTYKYTQDPPERPRWHSQMDNFSDIFQLWSLSGESCPEGTIPIRRTTEQDMLRASSLNRFGRKLINAGNGHEVCTCRNSIFRLSNSFFNKIFNTFPFLLL